MIDIVVVTMKIVALLIIVGLTLGSVAEAKQLANGKRISISALQKLLGTQATPVLNALLADKMVVAALHDNSPFRQRDFDLYMRGNDEHSIIDNLKAVVNRQEDNIGYIFVLTADDAIEQYEYFYYTHNRLEWLEIADKKINIQLTLAEVKFLDNDYTLDSALQDNHFYLARYRHEDQSSVRYLRELREALNGKLSEEVRDELRRHNLGEILLTPASLAEIAAVIDPTQQRRWQKALMALKAELTAEALVAGLRKSELVRDKFTAEQVEMAERVVSLKNASIAKRNRAIHGKLHFYAFRVPHAYLHNLLAKYAEDNNLSETQQQELAAELLRNQAVNYKAVKFGQTDSTRLWQAELAELTEPEREQVIRLTGIDKRIKTKTETKTDVKPSPRVKSLVDKINLDSGNVEGRIREQLREIIDLQLLKEIGGNVETLLNEAKILAYAPSAGVGMLDKDILHRLFGDDVKLARMVAGKNSNETVVFLDAAGEELALDAEVIELVRTRFSQSVAQFNDYLDRRERESIAFPRFAQTLRRSKGQDAARLSAEERILAYFEEHEEALQGYGIVIAEMATELGFSSGKALGHRIVALRKKLAADHFIHKIENKLKRIEGKNVSVYRLIGDALTNEEKRILAYFEAHEEALQEGGIVIAEMATELDFSSGISLGYRITALQKKLAADHFIHKIESKLKMIEGKLVTFYHLSGDALTREEKRALAYFEAHEEALQGDGIVIAEMATELGFSSGYSLGHRITALQKKLAADHFIHKIESKLKTIEGKNISVYRFSDALTNEEKRILAYFEAHEEALRGDGIVIAEMATELGFSRGSLLGRRITALRRKLAADHFIHKIKKKTKRIEDKRGIAVYRFSDTLTNEEKEILDYFEAHEEALQEDGIVIAEMAAKLGSNSYALGRRITALRQKLAADHFIHKIKRKTKRIEGKQVSFYRLE